MLERPNDLMDFDKILKIIAEVARERETVEIYYPATDNSPEGWREIEPYGLSTDIGNDGEDLIYGKDLISPGHILMARTVGERNNYQQSFILGKIKRVRKAKRKFSPKNNWVIKF